MDWRYGTAVTHERLAEARRGVSCSASTVWQVLSTRGRQDWRGGTRGCTHALYTSPEGLYLSVWPIFRFREPPLFIPWSDVRNRREKRWLWSRLIEFDVGSPPMGTMRLLPSVFRDAPNV